MFSYFLPALALAASAAALSSRFTRAKSICGYLEHIVSEADIRGRRLIQLWQGALGEGCLSTLTSGPKIGPSGLVDHHHRQYDRQVKNRGMHNLARQCGRRRAHQIVHMMEQVPTRQRNTEQVDRAGMTG